MPNPESICYKELQGFAVFQKTTCTDTSFQFNQMGELGYTHPPFKPGMGVLVDSWA